MTIGFKAGQSANGGLGLEREVSQTLNSHMSALEPTILRSECFTQNSRDEVRKINGDGSVAGSLSAEPGIHQTNYIKSEKHKEGETMLKAEVRRLTPTEGGRLQGFPEGYLDCLSADSTKYRVEGNSWAVPCARFVNKGIHRVLAKLEGKWRGLRYGSISSGVEAHSMSSVGFGDKAVFFSEIDPSPSSVLAHHYPNVPNLGDMKLVDYDAEKGVIHNRPYEGYEPPNEDDMGFKPYATETPVEIPFKHGEIDLVSGGTPCFAADTLVFSKSGEDALTWRRIQDLNVGDSVLTHTGRIGTVSKVGHKPAANMVRVTFENGFTLVCTDDHKFYAAVNPTEDSKGRVRVDGFQFVEISKIGVGGRIASPERFKTGHGISCVDGAIFERCAESLPKPAEEMWNVVAVKSIRQEEPTEVYNITVDGDHSYVVEGCVCVSNCQSFSVAGKRHGGAEGSGTRSSLAFQLPRIGKALNSKFILFENVPGVFSSAKGRDFLWFLYRCMEAGYTIAWRTLDAQFVRSDTHPRAVPQRRRRVWMVGYKGDDWRVPVQVLFEPMRVLGTEPPKRVVGKGFTSLVDKNADVNQKSDLEEFKEFLAAANPRIVKFCVDHGLSDPPEQTLKELEDAETAKGASGGDDMFAMFAPPEEKHQGRGLKAADLDLRLPDEADIRKVGASGLFSWARGVSESIGYCGELFQDWKWKQNLYCEATSPKDVYDGHCGKGAWDKLTADQQKKVFPELTPKAFYDRFHGEGSWDKLSEEDKKDVIYESVYKKVKTDEQSVYTLSETARFNIGNAGILSKGLICTLKTPEWNAGVTEEELAEMPKELAELYDGDVCGLCDILEANPSVIYKLSWRACYGICNRAKMRGKKLPIELAVALVERIIEQAAFVKWMAINGNKVSKQAGVKSESEIAKIAFDDYIEAEAHWSDVTEQQPTKSCELDDIEEEDDDADGDDGDTDEWERVKKD